MLLFAKYLMTEHIFQSTDSMILPCHVKWVDNNESFMTFFDSLYSILKLYYLHVHIPNCFVSSKFKNIFLAPQKTKCCMVE